MSSSERSIALSSNHYCINTGSRAGSLSHNITMGPVSGRLRSRALSWEVFRAFIVKTRSYSALRPRRRAGAYALKYPQEAGCRLSDLIFRSRVVLFNLSFEFIARNLVVENLFELLQILPFHGCPSVRLQTGFRTYNASQLPVAHRLRTSTMSRATLIIGFLRLNAAVGHGYTKFNPNCTSPDHSVNFVQSPGGRGTLDILWGCLFSIVACTWTILHINVPEQREGQNPGWRGDLKWMFKGFCIKLWWMLWTILAPELVLSVAVGNLSRKG
jgi:hypothetical protein